MDVWKGSHLWVRSSPFLKLKSSSHFISVNLGGWFVLEPFISPALFQKYPGAIDEWSLSEAMAADTAGGGLGQLEEHYQTFIVRVPFLFRRCTNLYRPRKTLPKSLVQVSTGFVFLYPSGLSTSGTANRFSREFAGSKSDSSVSCSCVLIHL